MDDALAFVPLDAQSGALSTWLIEAGLRGETLTHLLETYCEKLVAHGVPLLRMHVTMTAVHPNYEGLGFNWFAEGGAKQQEFAHTDEAPENWRQSPFHYMLSNNLRSYREPLVKGRDSRFPLLNEMREVGATDYLCQAVLFQHWEDGRPITENDFLDGAMVSWMVDGEGGFRERDLALIQSTFPTLCLALKSSSQHKMAQDLLGVYLGKDAGRRVLKGEIERGSTQWIDAVICYFDFEGFTAHSQAVEGEALIAMLNAYFDPVVTAIEAEGGNVLKFMGDGLLAIFDRSAFPDAPNRGVRALARIEEDLACLSAQRAGDGHPVFGYTAALHIGRVLYGNIGASERLDFTVIGPDVNLAARIAGMHTSLGQSVILSGELAQHVTEPSFEPISLGRYMLRGVAKPQELFTLYRADLGSGDAEK